MGTCARGRVRARPSSPRTRPLSEGASSLSLALLLTRLLLTRVRACDSCSRTVTHTHMHSHAHALTRTCTRTRPLSRARVTACAVSVHPDAAAATPVALRVDVTVSRASRDVWSVSAREEGEGGEEEDETDGGDEGDEARTLLRSRTRTLHSKHAHPPLKARAPSTQSTRTLGVVTFARFDSRMRARVGAYILRTYTLHAHYLPHGMLTLRQCA
eukprot:221223-Pleurochrysis_carterae.AAC.2